MLAYVRFLVAGLLLAVPRCAGWPTPPAASPPPTALAAGAAPEPVGPLIRVLLDTAGSSATTADARLGLKMGPAVRSLYGSVPATQWLSPEGVLSPAAATVLRLMAQAPAFGLRPAYYLRPTLQTLTDSAARCQLTAAQQARLDVALSDAALRLMQDLHRGRLRPYTRSPLEQALHRPLALADTLRQALALGRVEAAVLACQPQHGPYRELQAALARWLQQPISPDSALQHEAQYEQAALNLERGRWYAILDSAYAFINLPTYELTVVRAEQVIRRHRVIIGKPQTPTPTLSSRIRYFTLAPDWHVPRSIATKELLPRLRRDPGYLARHNYTLYDARGRLLDPYGVNWQLVTSQSFAYSIRQSAGCDNALGNVVFRFDNPYAIYLHDTPARELFAQPLRTFSHGCIRLEQPMALAAWLLRREHRTVPLPSEAECARQNQPRTVSLHWPLALHVRYFTCTADKGQLRFWPDVYHRDEALRRQLFGPASSGVAVAAAAAAKE